MSVGWSCFGGAEMEFRALDAILGFRVRAGPVHSRICSLGSVNFLWCLKCSDLHASGPIPLGGLGSFVSILIMAPVQLLPLLT